MTKLEAKNRISKLKGQLKEIDHAYYVLDAPLVTDAVRDSLKDELEKLEKQHPELVTADSPTQRVGGKALGRFAKHRHSIPKYSLDDMFSIDEVIDFDGRVKKGLGLSANEDIEYLAELKIDGLNISLIYKDGVLEKAVTRGDGLEGEVVTHTIRTIGSIPLSLKEKIDIEVGGEVFMPVKSFEALNKKSVQKFANPRNAAAGTVRQLDPKVASSRNLDAFIWAIYEPQKYDLVTQEDVFNKLKKLGFKINPYIKKIIGFSEIEKHFSKWKKARLKLDYGIDGVVLKVNDLDSQDKLGRTAKHVRWAAAYKFPAEQVTTVVEDIQVQVGRTGALTPVAHLTPVNLAGSVVKRATLHNQDEIDRLDVRIGDTVILQKAGDIIPDIIETLPKMRTGKEKKFKMPEECPICGFKVVKKSGEVAHYCSNNECYAVQKENLSHFVSKKAFNIDGLGPKILEQLQIADLVKDAGDIFSLTKEDLDPLERFADKSVDNLLKSVEGSKNITLAKFIYALGIRHVGEETAILLAAAIALAIKQVGVIGVDAFSGAINNLTLENIETVDGVGPIVAKSFYDWFKNEKSIVLISKLNEAQIQIELPETKDEGKLVSKTFVLTGEMRKMTRDEAKDMIRSLGGSVSSSVSKKTDYVVAGSNPGSKYDKAQKLEVKILDEDQFLGLLK
jgi:DNA ligase (NAD+)